MSKQVAINGFGRIGRAFFRHAWRRDEFTIAAINDVADTPTLAHLLKYDSAHGRFPGEVAVAGERLIVDGRVIEVLHRADPRELPWREMNIWLALEATGCNKGYAFLQKHRDAGAERVLLSANVAADDQDRVRTFVLGVNEGAYDPARDFILSNASCTTNGLAPVLRLLDDHYKVLGANFTTVHAYTQGQNLIDGPCADLRRARAAAANIVPTSTGATDGLAVLFPHLRGKIGGLSLRVPILNVSLIDLSVVLKEYVKAELVNAQLRAAAQGDLRGILSIVSDPVVSGDMNGSTASATVDEALTQVVAADGAGWLLKLMLWYDNEIGYVSRLIELINHMLRKE
ncbi:MAG TPA: glyceraldehyde 3-phosphate dehydrogenase NAD-binding domain-containing protein [bacterium]|nr:glyceraldehyde 3-phosphate dehydrogenase NAD-binding domain-containing protein [bacterium]